MRTLILILLLAFCGLLRAEDWTTTDGVVHKNIIIVKADKDSVTTIAPNGYETILLANLPPDIQKRYGYTPPKIDPMKATASWKSIILASGKVIPITNVTSVDAHSVHYISDIGCGAIEMSNMTPDEQKQIGYDPIAAAKAIADEQAKEAATDASIAQAQAAEKAVIDKAQAAAANTPLTEDQKAAYQDRITALQHDGQQAWFQQRKSDSFDMDGNSVYTERMEADNNEIHRIQEILRQDAMKPYAPARTTSSP